MLPHSRRAQKKHFPLFRGPFGNFSAGPITLHITKNAITEPTRLSVVVSKKVAGSAVVRNRIRRKIVGVARPLVLKSKSGFVCVLYPKKETTALSITEIRVHVEKIFTFAGLL